MARTRENGELLRSFARRRRRPPLPGRGAVHRRPDRRGGGHRGRLGRRLRGRRLRERGRLSRRSRGGRACSGCRSWPRTPTSSCARPPSIVAHAVRSPRPGGGPRASPEPLRGLASPAMADTPPAAARRARALMGAGRPPRRWSTRCWSARSSSSSPSCSSSTSPAVVLWLGSRRRCAAWRWWPPCAGVPRRRVRSPWLLVGLRAAGAVRALAALAPTRALNPRPAG